MSQKAGWETRACDGSAQWTLGVAASASGARGKLLLVTGGCRQETGNGFKRQGCPPRGGVARKFACPPSSGQIGTHSHSSVDLTPFHLGCPRAGPFQSEKKQHSRSTFTQDSHPSSESRTVHRRLASIPSALDSQSLGNTRRFPSVIAQRVMHPIPILIFITLHLSWAERGLHGTLQRPTRSRIRRPRKIQSGWPPCPIPSRRVSQWSVVSSMV